MVITLVIPVSGLKKERVFLEKILDFLNRNWVAGV